jgi:hypothetical protein
VGTKGNFLPRTRPINLIGSQVAPATSIADEDARLAQFQSAFANLAGTPTRRSNRIDGRYNVINYVGIVGQLELPRGAVRGAEAVLQLHVQRELHICQGDRR